MSYGVNAVHRVKYASPLRRRRDEEGKSRHVTDVSGVPPPPLLIEKRGKNRGEVGTKLIDT